MFLPYCLNILYQKISGLSRLILCQTNAVYDSGLAIYFSRFALFLADWAGSNWYHFIFPTNFCELDWPFPVTVPFVQYSFYSYTSPFDNQGAKTYASTVSHDANLSKGNKFVCWLRTHLFFPIVYAYIISYSVGNVKTYFRLSLGCFWSDECPAGGGWWSRVGVEPPGCLAALQIQFWGARVWGLWRSGSDTRKGHEPLSSCPFLLRLFLLLSSTRCSDSFPCRWRFQEWRPDCS